MEERHTPMRRFRGLEPGRLPPAITELTFIHLVREEGGEDNQPDTTCGHDDGSGCQKSGIHGAGS